MNTILLAFDWGFVIEKLVLIIGIVSFIAITLLMMNLLVDIAYAYLDPRIRY